MSDFDLHGFRIEPFKVPPAPRLIDMNLWRIEGTVNESTPILEAACVRAHPVNMIFTEGEERRQFPAYVQSFESDGKIMKATIRAAGAVEGFLDD